MRIAFLAAECAPVAKAGGLGDFVHGLGRALLAAGTEVEILLPDYDCLRHELIIDRQVLRDDLWFDFAGQRLRCRVSSGQVDGLSCRFLAPQSSEAFFARGRIYGEPDDALRFACYCRAALEWLHQSAGWPDILHCNDWQTGLVPVLLREDFAQRGPKRVLDRVRVCYSLHNLGYQGWVEPQVLTAAGLDAARLMTPDRLSDSAGAVDAKLMPRANLMQGGIVFSNFVTTVSPRYAWEVLRTEQGMGLQGVLAAKQAQGRFAGVLNGIDWESWNPQTDPFIAQSFNADSLALKAANTAALRMRLGLQAANKPLVAIVSRLDRQKGVDLISHAMVYTMEKKGQCVLLGSAQEPQIQTRFEQLRDHYSANPDCHLTLGYDEELAHQIYAGADLMLVPSLYEPCGLTQLIAMRYGCVPVVSRVGGLADTVFDANFCGKPLEQRNGFVFDNSCPFDLEFALERALGLWSDHPEQFDRLRANGMAAEHSWTRPARDYLEIYRWLLGDGAIK
ncbi:glycogen synthase [Thiorhodovibrio frisius]|uniref:Glycogen synthase n=1 Tax=Thiorhodovibrio frisius TaxID=631362 RepID=H8YYK5_9GAMM|nr:glycogen synthase [Thiorhodovibrio frisius]EIC23531.1 glycogen/starch synthase, ADP-glucose type [Thiorhodovibrio frisius]WPL23382.1 putative glycogen synthase 2 [Thiorhodovibrio frisius]